MLIHALLLLGLQIDGVANDEIDADAYETSTEVDSSYEMFVDVDAAAPASPQPRMAAPKAKPVGPTTKTSPASTKGATLSPRIGRIGPPPRPGRMGVKQPVAKPGAKTIDKRPIP